jgi:acetyltransferase
VAKLLAGYRDRAPADLDAIAMTLVRISQLIADLPAITEIDINPVLADDKGVIALDARIKVDWAHADLAAPNPRFAIRPYPNNWEKEVETPDGRRLLLRPIRSTDEEAYRAFVAAITPEDWRLRFFSPSRHVSPDFILRFTQIDYARAKWPSSRSSKARARFSACLASSPTRTMSAENMPCWSAAI